MSVEENKNVARKYHDLNPDDTDKILTPEFIGRQVGTDTWTWNIRDHKRFLSEEGKGTKDTIHQQVAEGEWVATRFHRTMHYQGKVLELDMMHFKRFEGGKIAELWELTDQKQFGA